MTRALFLIAGCILLAGGFLASALRRIAPASRPERDAASASLRLQLRTLEVECERLKGENARLSLAAERLRAGPPSPAHQRIHETLLPALAEARDEVAEPALLVLAGVDPLDRPCAEALLDKLRTARLDRTRILAAQALSMRRDRLVDLDRSLVAGGLLLAARQDRSGDVRRAALGSFDDDAPSQANLEDLFAIAASDADESTRCAASRALARVKPVARGPFLARVERVFESEASRSVRRELVEAAVKAGGDAAAPTLDRLRRLAPDLAGEIDGALKGFAATPSQSSRDPR